MGITDENVKAKRRYVVITDHGVKHPVGTLVEIEDKCSYGLYCKAVGGQTAYWYNNNEIMDEKEWEAWVR